MKEDMKQIKVFKDSEPLELEISIAFTSNAEIVEGVKQLIGISAPLYTFAEWKRRGFSVRKGEKAFLKIPLWGRWEKEVDGKMTSGFYSKMTALFLPQQVEEAEQKGA